MIGNCRRTIGFVLLQNLFHTQELALVEYRLWCGFFMTPPTVLDISAARSTNERELLLDLMDHGPATFECCAFIQLE